MLIEKVLIIKSSLKYAQIQIITENYLQILLYLRKIQKG